MKYRVLVNMIEEGYVDVDADTYDEVHDKAYEEIEAGGFVGSNFHAEVVGVENE